MEPSKSRQDEDCLSLAASDEDIEALMEEASGKPDASNEGSELQPDNDTLKELTSPFNFRTRIKWGQRSMNSWPRWPPSDWGKKLAREKVTALLAKYDPPENCFAISGRNA